MRFRNLLLLLLLVASAPTTATAAETDSTRVFSEANPLVYEDAWDLWPYSFLNEYGEPVGYNIDLLTLIFEELNIPLWQVRHTNLHPQPGASPKRGTEGAACERPGA